MKGDSYVGLKEKHKKNLEEKECNCKKSCDSENKPEESKNQEESENLKKELEETKQLLLRTAAEYDNFRKRSEREKESIYSDASALTILSILPVADSLDAAIKSSGDRDEEYKKGINLLKNQIDSAFKNLRVEAFGDCGDDFDPNIHNAIAHKDTDEERQNFISTVYQKGYRIGDRIIRHALVEVTN